LKNKKIENIHVNLTKPPPSLNLISVLLLTGTTAVKNCINKWKTRFNLVQATCVM